MNKMSERRLVIIGAGVVGLCCGYYAQKSGWNVTILESGSSSRTGCSFGNAGMIVPSHVVPLAAPGMLSLGLRMMFNRRSPFAIKPRVSIDLLNWSLDFMKAATPGHVQHVAPLLRDLNLSSREAYVELETELGPVFDLKQRGLIMLCKTTKMLEEEGKAAELARGLGVPAEVLDAQAVAALDPGVTMDVSGGIYFPKDCHLSPDKFVNSLTQRFIEIGGSVVLNAEVTSWRSCNNRIVAAVTEAGEYEGDEFVLCSGAWSSTLAKKLGLRIPMQAGKGYSITLGEPPQMPEICSILMEARVAVTPMGNKLRFGGTMEIAGLDESVSHQRVHGIIDSIPTFFPSFSTELFVDKPVWSGLRPCSPDGIPYIGRFSTFTNLVCATGHAMMGLSLAPITGKIVADILMGVTPPFDMQALSPNRYQPAN